MHLRELQRKYSRSGRRIWPSASFIKVRLNAAKITLIFAMLGALVLSFMDYRNQQLTKTIKMMIVDATLPLIDLSAGVTQKLTHDIRDLFTPYKKYERRLQEKDKTIQLWKLEAQRLHNEIRILQDLLNYKKDFKVSAVTSQMFIPNGHQFGYKGFLDVGAKSGIQKNSVVISSQGLVGKVVSVGQRTSEVILLDHPLSAVPVYIERTNVMGVVKGDVRQSIALEYVSTDQLKNGDRLLTSGQGGIFPRGINVAVVEKQSEGIKIQPLHELRTTLFVYVLSPLTEETTNNVD